MKLGRPAIYGLIGVGVSAAVYPLVASSAGTPLAMFVLAPLGVAVVADHSDTRAVAVVAVVVAAVEGVTTGLEGPALAARMMIIVIGASLAVLGARLRTQRERELLDSEVQRTLLSTFQEGLVPVPAPPPGIVAASCYRPAALPLRIGGDFVDVIALPDGTAGFIIGDVCGHGPRAAAFGSRIRAAWKGIAWTVPRHPTRWLQELDRAFFEDRRFDGYVTALAGRLSIDGSVEAVCAGHPPPLLLTTCGVTPVAMQPDVPLGIDTSTRRRTTSFLLPAAASMLLYTDGLTENSRLPGGRPGEEGLLAALSDGGPLTALDDLMLRFGPDGFDDDVAILQLSVAACVAGGLDVDRAMP